VLLMCWGHNFDFIKLLFMLLGMVLHCLRRELPLSLWYLSVSLNWWTGAFFSHSVQMLVIFLFHELFNGIVLYSWKFRLWECQTNGELHDNCVPPGFSSPCKSAVQCHLDLRSTSVAQGVQRGLCCKHR
jgi:hypothetical protein